MNRLLCLLALCQCAIGFASGAPPVARFEFEGNLQNAVGQKVSEREWKGIDFVRGVEGKALRLRGERTEGSYRPLANLKFDSENDFSIQFWVRTEGTEASVLVSNKIFGDRSLKSQKKAGMDP